MVNALVQLRNVLRRPFFTVVVATYQRDSYITPTLESIANQEFRDFEVKVVSDGPPSDILRKVVREFGDSFSLHYTPSRTRSQSGPNNLGWKIARGKYIAYLGHDDVWSPEHLKYLAESYESNESLDFAVSGCVYFGPAGTDDRLTWITGVFDNQESGAAGKHFLPPSSLSHRRELPREIPRWREPMTARRPVDTEFVIGAFERGCRFASTGRISVYKFASALRYLSYFCPDDWEQRQILTLMKNRIQFEKFIQDRVNASKVNGNYMRMQHASLDQFEPGQIVMQNELTRGINIPSVSNLTTVQRVEVGLERMGFDWHSPERIDGHTIRWSGPSNRPRLLLPFCSRHEVRFSLKVVAFVSEEIKNSLKITLNRKQVEFQIIKFANCFIITFVSSLYEDRISVLEFQMSQSVRPADQNEASSDVRKLGLCLEYVELYPIYP